MIETWKNDFMEFVNSLNLSRDDYKTMMEYINEVPAVQPDHNADVSKKAEGDCVSRKTALDAFGLSEKTRKYDGDHSGYDTRMLYEIQDTLEDLPAVQPERKHGKWERHYSKPNVYADLFWHCSVCGYKSAEYWAQYYNFCPSCGAYMGKGEPNANN